MIAVDQDTIGIHAANAAGQEGITTKNLGIG